MKRFGYTALFAIAVLSATSCYNDIEAELTALERRVATLTQRAATINDNIASLQDMVDKYSSYVYVSSYRPIYSGKEIQGYVIRFSDGSSVTLNNGVSKDDPIVGLKLEDDGLYYWIVTINGVTDYFYDEAGQKVAASVASPIMKIVDGVWKVSFDNGHVWQTFDKATAADGYSYIESIVTRGDYIDIKLVSGQTVSFPTYSLYENYFNQVNRLNSDIEALRVIYQAKASKNYVKTVSPIKENDKIIGYTIVFSDSQTITVYDGKAYESEEQIGLVQDTDGEYYWAVFKDGKSTWLYNDLGTKVQASPTESEAPVFLLDNSAGDGKYYWMYKYGESGTPRYIYDAQGKKVAASASGIVQVFSSVVVNENFILFNPLKGDSFYVPRYDTFTIALGSTSVKISAETGKANVFYTVRNVSSTVAITAVTEPGYYSSMTKTYDAAKRELSGTITITADSSAAASSVVTILVSDGKGHMETHRITVSK